MSRRDSTNSSLSGASVTPSPLPLPKKTPTIHPLEQSCALRQAQENPLGWKAPLTYTATFSPQTDEPLLIPAEQQSLVHNEARPSTQRQTATDQERAEMIAELKYGAESVLSLVKPVSFVSRDQQNTAFPPSTPSHVPVSVSLAPPRAHTSHTNI